MVKMTFKIFCLVSLFIVVSAAHAAEDNAYEKAEQYQQKVITSCKEKSQTKWDTGNTMMMQEGTQDYIRCLTDEITKISNGYFVSYDDKSNEDEKEAQTEFLSNLKLYTQQSLKLYEDIHSGPCAPCGTQHDVFYMMDAATDLEKVMKTMLVNAYEYHRPLEQIEKAQ